MTAAVRSLLFLLVGLCSAGADAAQLALPELQARVTDLTGTLDPSRRVALESKLAAFEREKGSQIAVLLVPTTQPETIEQYSIRVVDAWKLGREKADDGVLLLVAKDDRTMRIEVGQGLEGVIPDAIAKRIIEETILPRFRDGDFAGGVEAGVDQILGRVGGEALPEPAGPEGDKLFDGIVWMSMVALFVGELLSRLLSRLFGAFAAGGIAFTLAMLVLGTLGIAIAMALGVAILSATGLVSRGRSGSYRGGGGSGGGGFSGGGGGFSGGGASGRW
ncbi:MAG: TPM domain-containing protein [Panacagrimonas sp.]